MTTIKMCIHKEGEEGGMWGQRWWHLMEAGNSAKDDFSPGEGRKVTDTGGE